MKSFPIVRINITQLIKTTKPPVERRKLRQLLINKWKIFIKKNGKLKKIKNNKYIYGGKKRKLPHCSER